MMAAICCSGLAHTYHLLRKSLVKHLRALPSPGFKLELTGNGDYGYWILLLKIVHDQSLTILL